RALPCFVPHQIRRHRKQPGALAHDLLLSQGADERLLGDFLCPVAIAESPNEIANQRLMVSNEEPFDVGHLLPVSAIPRSAATLVVIPSAATVIVIPRSVATIVVIPSEATRCCHPERSEGSAFATASEKQIPRRYAPRDDNNCRCARNDNKGGCAPRDGGHRQ